MFLSVLAAVDTVSRGKMFTNRQFRDAIGSARALKDERGVKGVACGKNWKKIWKLKWRKNGWWKKCKLTVRI